MIRFGLTTLTLVAVGCGGSGPSEADFQAQFATAACEAFFECGTTGTTGISFFDNQEDCEQFYQGIFAIGSIGCSYDGVAADSCLDAIESASCDDVGTDVTGGTECDNVYSGSACGVDLGGSTTGT